MKLFGFDFTFEKLSFIWQRVNSHNFTKKTKFIAKQNSIQIINPTFVFVGNPKDLNNLKIIELQKSTNNSNVTQKLIEKNNFGLLYKGFNINPETIYKAIGEKEFQPYITGKFIIGIIKKINAETILIQIELTTSKPIFNLRNRIKNKIHKTLFLDNLNYKIEFDKFGENIKPVIKLIKFNNFENLYSVDKKLRL